jgi:enamine deaminase RidA (YjgF/YER057c/UK114 family)
MTLARTHSWPEGHWDWPIHLSHKHGIRCGDMIFVGGQVSLDPQGNVVDPGDIARQTRTVMANIARVLAGFGAGPGDVVKLTAFYESGRGLDADGLLAEMGRAIDASPGPAVVAVPMPCLAYPEMVVEIEAVAMLGVDGAHLARTASVPEGHAPLPAPFSHGLRCGEMIFVSGQTARDASGAVRYPGDIVRQSEAVMENLSAVLAGFGATLDDTVKINAWYAGEGTAEDWETGARVRAGRFAEPGPAATGIPLPGLDAEGLAIAIDIVAMLGEDGSRLPRSHVWPEGHWDWTIHLPYKHGVRCGRLIFLGGQVSLTPDAKVIDPADMVAQTHTSMANIRRVLAGFGAGLDDVVKVGAFYEGGASAGDLHRNLEIRSASFTEPGPASTGIPLPCLAYRDMVIEIEVVAMVE